MPDYEADIRNALHSRHRIVYLQSSEEQRVLAALARVATETFGGDQPVRTWNCTRGLDGADAATTRDPVAALQAIQDDAAGGVFAMLDLADHLHRPEVVRALRDVYGAWEGRRDRALVILSPILVIPRTLEKEVALIEVPTPDTDELVEHVRAIEAEYPEATLPDNFAHDLALALKGLTLNEATHVLHRVLRGSAADKQRMLREVFAEKEVIIKKSGYLEFIPPYCRIEDIGGLDTLKDWLVKRQDLFNQDALEQGLPLPKGMLVMGVSGCGKSFAAKSVSALWNVPLFRLDMNLVFSGLYGSPEATFHHALRTVEAVAPAVLWIDEIENGLGLTEEGGAGGGSTSHLFSAFLTWMQEKPPLIFIAATANRIQALPAEVIRKGRFDEVFFCDLPQDKEREEIWQIHLRRNGADPANFKMDYLVIDSDGWNGAEIEQAVVTARINALQEDRMFENRDITSATARMVPLSQTMREQIKALRDWAFGRAENASKYGRRRG